MVWSSLKRCSTTSITAAKNMLNSNGDSTHPCRSPSETSNHSEGLPSSMRTLARIPSWNWRRTSVITDTTPAEVDATHVQRNFPLSVQFLESADYEQLLLLLLVFFTLTDWASTIPSNIRGCQSGTWSQRGTKVNGSPPGDNPLLRPTGIQIATKCYATLQAMTPSNNKTFHQTSFTPYREQPRSTRIVVAYPRPAFSATNRTDKFQPVLINNSKFLKATHRTKIRKIEIPRSMVVEALSW